MHDAYISGRFQQTKIARKASDVAEHAIIMCCSVLPPEIVVHDAYIGRCSENNTNCGVHDDLGRKNQTTQYNCRFSAASLALRVIFSVS